MVLVLVSFGSGCIKARIPNTAWMVGGRVANTSGGEASSGSVGGLGVNVSAAHTDGITTGWGHVDAFLGGNSAGWAGEAELEAEGGLALFDGEHHLLLRGGLGGTVERNPYSGLMLLELPVATVGYQFHGQGSMHLTDALHVDLGGRGGLAAAGRTFGADDVADFAARPQLGGIATVLWEAIAVRLQYDHMFAGPAWNVIRSEACFELFFAVCVDTRHVLTTFDGEDRGTQFIGVSFGGGLAKGFEYGF